MNYTVKKYMGLAMLCASQYYVPIGETDDDADAKVEVMVKGEHTTFRVFDPKSNFLYFSCELCGLPTLEDAESMIRVAFERSMLDVPKELFDVFTGEYKRGD